MPIPIGVPIAGQLLGGGLSFLGGRRARKDAKVAAAAQDRRRRLDAARERRALARQGAQAIGEVTVAGAASGAESSSAITGRSGLLNQLASQLNFIAQTEEIGNTISKANSGVARGQRFQDIGSSIFNLSGSLY